MVETQTARDVQQLADDLVGLVRAFNRARAKAYAEHGDDVEWSSQVILRALRHDGPMRSGELAASLQSDPSTVSRQTATMVKDGLLERRADPGDGRASLLVPTPAAHEVLQAHDERRNARFAAMLVDWSDEDIERFGELLHRFNQAFDSVADSKTAASTPGRHLAGPTEGKH